MGGFNDGDDGRGMKRNETGPTLMKKMGELMPNLKSRRERIAKEKADREASARAEKEKAAAAAAAASQANVKKKGKKKGKR